MHGNGTVKGVQVNDGASSMMEMSDGVVVLTITLKIRLFLMVSYSFNGNKLTPRL